MKSIHLTLIAVLLVTFTAARDRDQEKLALQKLIQEREVHFGEYSRAAASRTGFFGNQSKKDLKGQVEILTDIIKTDNRIISTLNTFLDYRTFQRTETNYSQAELDEKNQRLNNLTTILSNKLKAAEADKKSVHLQARWARVWNYLLIAIVLVLGYFLWKEKRAVRMMNAKC